MNRTIRSLLLSVVGNNRIRSKLPSIINNTNNTVYRSLFTNKILLTKSNNNTNSSNTNNSNNNTSTNTNTTVNYTIQNANYPFQDPISDLNYNINVKQYIYSSNNNNNSNTNNNTDIEHIICLPGFSLYSSASIEYELLAIELINSIANNTANNRNQRRNKSLTISLIDWPGFGLSELLNTETDLANISHSHYKPELFISFLYQLLSQKPYKNHSNNHSNLAIIAAGHSINYIAIVLEQLALLQNNNNNTANNNVNNIPIIFINPQYRRTSTVLNSINSSLLVSYYWLLSMRLIGYKLYKSLYYNINTIKQYLVQWGFSSSNNHSNSNNDSSNNHQLLLTNIDSSNSNSNSNNKPTKQYWSHIAYICCQLDLVSTDREFINLLYQFAYHRKGSSNNTNTINNSTIIIGKSLLSPDNTNNSNSKLANYQLSQYNQFLQLLQFDLGFNIELIDHGKLLIHREFPKQVANIVMKLINNRK